MSGFKIAAILLVLVGALALFYGGFSYTKETHQAHLGPFSFVWKDKGSVNIPVWVGVGTLVAGGLMLVVPRRRT